VTHTDGSPIHRIGLLIRAATAGSSAYPLMKANRIGVEIDLPARFPFERPAARITTPILHPNVGRSGNICFGSTWIPTHGLDLVVRQIVDIVTFDPAVSNPSSPLNGAAASWYRDALRRHPRAFPTDRLAELLR
jgi:ubiquitin-protein ligase